jgi:hypothetical protein
MVWEWSHSQEGIDNVKSNIRNLDSETLAIIYSQILTYKECLFRENHLRQLVKDEEIIYPTSSGNYFDINIYNYIKDSEILDDLVEGHKISTEEYTELSELVFEYASNELRECDNGGFNAYLDPYHDHTVPFSSHDEIENIEYQIQENSSDAK